MASRQPSSPAARALILRNADFRRVWISQVLSQAGLRMVQIGLVWHLIGDAAGEASGLRVGIFMLLGALPSLALVKLVGRVLDSAPSQRIMLTAMAIAGVAIAFVAAQAHAAGAAAMPLVSLYAAGLVLATAQAFIDPTLAKSVGELVDEADVEAAVAFETSTQSLANFGGAVFGAVLIERLGVAGVAGVAAVGYALAAVMLARAHFRPLPGLAEGAAPEAGPGGLALLATMPFIRAVLLCFAAANFFATPIFIALPLYAKLVLGADATMLARLEAAFWLGLIAGAWGGRLLPAAWRATTIGWVAMLIFAVLLGAPAAHVDAGLLLACLLGCGVCLGINNLKFVSLFQLQVPPEVKGRFFAVMQALLSSTFPVAYFVFGAASDYLGARGMLAVEAVGLGVVALALLALGRRQEAVAGVPAGGS